MAIPPMCTLMVGISPSVIEKIVVTSLKFTLNIIWKNTNSPTNVYSNGGNLMLFLNLGWVTKELLMKTSASKKIN